jgi:hypothetical protein
LLCVSIAVLRKLSRCSVDPGHCNSRGRDHSGVNRHNTVYKVQIWTLLRAQGKGTFGVHSPCLNECHLFLVQRCCLGKAEYKLLRKIFGPGGGGGGVWTEVHSEKFHDSYCSACVYTGCATSRCTEIIRSRGKKMCWQLTANTK